MNFSYIAALDYDHLDNGLFLKSFADAIAAHKERGLIIHGDSDYTERIMQTGVMREDARIRAIKDLNNRLVALLADEGVSAIGLNGYQRELIRIKNGTFRVDIDQFKRLPDQPVLLISSLVYSDDTGKPAAATLKDIIYALQNALNINDTFLFTRSEENDVIKKNLPATITEAEDPDTFIQNNIPAEFHQFKSTAQLISPDDFRHYPDVKNSTRLKNISISDQ